MARQWIQKGGAGAAGPPGPSGSGGSSGPAPAITAAWITNLQAKYLAYGHDYKVSAITGTITPPVGTDCTHLKYIRVIKTGPNPDPRANDITVNGPFSVGTSVSFSVECNDILTPAALTYTLEFDPANEDDTITTPVYTTTVMTVPPTIQTVSVSETPGLRQADENRGLTTNGIHVDVTLANNPGGVSGTQVITIWTLYDWGDGRGTVTTWKGWYLVTGNTVTQIYLNGDNDVWVTTLANTTFAVKVAIGAIDKEAAIPVTATNAAFIFQGPGALSNAEITCGLLGVNYFRVSGQNFWGWKGIQGTNPTNPEVWFGRFYLSRGSWNAITQTWTYDTAYAPVNPETGFNEWAVGDTEDTTVTTDGVAGHSFTTIASDPQPFAAPGATSVQFMIRMLAFTRRNNDAGTAEACWIGSAPTDAQYSLDHKFCIITPDQTRAFLIAGDIDVNTLGDRLGITGGKLNVSSTPAPAPTAVSVDTLRSTSGGTLPAIGGLPVWNADIRVTLATTNPAFGHTKQIKFSIPGFSDFTISSWTIVSTNQIVVTLPTEYQDNAAHAYVLSVFTVNEDGTASTAVTATLNVPAGSVPFGGSGNAPAAPAITAATASVNYQRYGHDWLVGYTVSFTAPANPGAAPYTVRVSKIFASGARATIDTLNGPFTPGNNYGFTTDNSDPLPNQQQNWTIEFLPINTDNIPTLPAKQVTVIVAPNVITGLTGNEGVHFIEAGDGSMTHAVVTPTISTANAPGMTVALPQTVTFYLSVDNGVTWFGLGWVDQSQSGQANTFDLWRPTDASKPNCKFAAAIGAWNFPDGPVFNGINSTGPIPDANLPALVTFRMIGTFTLNVVGAPSALGVTNAQINPRTASGAAAYFGTTLEKTSDGAAFLGWPDGISWTNPTAAQDPDFWYSALVVFDTDSAGNQAPLPTGLSTEHQGLASATPGARVTVTEIDWWPFNPAGSIYTYEKFQIVCYSRGGGRTIQTNAWTGSPPIPAYMAYSGSFALVRFGDAPSSSIIANVPVTAGPGISVSGSTVSVKLPGAASNLLQNPGGESGTANWTTFGGNPTSNTSNQRTGSACLQINASLAFAEQTVSYTSVGITVQLSVYVASFSTAGVQIFLRCRDASNNILSATSQFVNPNGGVYQQIFLSLTTVFNTAFLDVAIQASSGSGFWVFDDASLTAVSGATPGGIGVNGNGELVALVGQGLDTSTGSIIIPNGTLSNLSGNLYTTSARPVGVVFGLPSLPNSLYPQGCLIFNTADSKIYRNKTGSAWSADAAPSDLAAGTIAAGVVYAGTINAASINAGTMSAVNMSGGTLSLVSNGVSTIINNGFNPGAGVNVGFSCQNQSAGNYTTVDPGAFRIQDPQSNSVWQALLQTGSGYTYGYQVLLGTGGANGNQIQMRADNTAVRLFHALGGEIRLWYNGGSGAGGSMYIEVRDSGGNSMVINSRNILRNGVVVV